MTSFTRQHTGGTKALHAAPIYLSLYDSAKRFPSQKNTGEVFSKLILVGRSLGITLERRHCGLRIQDSRSVMAVAEKICQSSLQTQLRKVKPAGHILSEDPKHVLACHRVLEEIFIAAGVKASTELAAAYLHVHRNRSFPLLNGSARIGAKLYFESRGKDSSDLSRVTRPGGYEGWLSACKNIIQHLQADARSTVCLLHLNDFLERQTVAELRLTE